MEERGRADAARRGEHKGERRRQYHRPEQVEKRVGQRRAPCVCICADRRQSGRDRRADVVAEDYRDCRPYVYGPCLR